MQRLVKGSGANGLALAARVLEQLLLVPLLLGVWPVALYGEWLLLSAVPVYLSLSDLGFLSAGSNELARRGGAAASSPAEDARLRRFFGDFTSVFLRWSLGLALLFGALAWGAPLDRWLGLTVLTRDEAALTLALLAANALVAQNGLALLGGLRARRLFHLGLLIRALEAFARLLAVLLLVTLGGAGPVGIAATTLAVTAVSYAAEAALLRRHGLPPVWRPLARLSEPMRPWLGAGLELMLMPLSQAIVLQGMVLMVGATLGAVAVAVFAAHRTLARLTLQILNLASGPFRAEAGLLQGPGDRAALGRLLGALSRLTLWAAVLLAGALFLLGPWILTLWTGGRIGFHPALFAGLLLAAVLEGIWSVAAGIRLGSNRHRPLVWGYLGFSLAGLALARSLATTGGLDSLAGALVAIDAAMCLLTIPVTVALIDMRTGAYLRALLRPPVAELRGLWRRVRPGPGPMPGAGQRRAA